MCLVLKGESKCVFPQLKVNNDLIKLPARTLEYTLVW